MATKTTYNGNDIDRTIPYTPTCYTQITDDDYRPLPGEQTMTDPVEIARAADVDNAVNQPDEPIMYTGEAFADCAADLLLPDDPKEMDEMRQDLMFAVWWMEQQGKGIYGNDSAARRTRATYESVFRFGIRQVLNLMEQGVTSEQLGMEE